MFRLRYIFIPCLMFVTLTSAQQFPSDVERCTYKDERCLINVVTNILSEHSQGHKGLNLPPLDPLRISSLSFAKIPGSPVNIDLKVTDANLTGLSRATVTKVSGFERDPSNLEFELELRVPKLVISGKYNIDGTILVVPISGEGNSTAEFENVLIEAKLMSSTKTKDKKIYINIYRAEVALKPSLVKMQFDNLFGGDKTLGDSMNKLLNENWEIVFSELQSLIQEALAKIIVKVVNGPFSKIPYNIMFLPTF